MAIKQTARLHLLNALPENSCRNRKHSLKSENGDRRVEVLKSYDQSYAREAFKNMDEEAQQHLWDSLKPEDLRSGWTAVIRRP